MNFSIKYSSLLLAFVFILSGFFLTDRNLQVWIIREVNNLLSLSLDEQFRSFGISYLATILIFCGMVILLYFLRVQSVISDALFWKLSVAALAFHYFFHLIANSVNFPVYDDQGAVLNFLLEYNSGTDSSERVKLLFTPYNECVMTVPRLLALASFQLFGEINFRNLIILNGFALLFFHWFLFRISGTRSTSWPVFFVLSLFIFQFQYYDDAFWVISGWSYYGVMIFTMLAFHFFKSESIRVRSLAWFPALLATVTFSNGWLSFPVGIGFLLFQKRYRESTAWLLALLVISLFYFINRSGFHMLSEVNWSIIDNILFVLTFLGSGFQFFYTAHLPLLIGLFILTILIWSTYRKIYQVCPVQYMMLVFIILSALIAAPFRSGIEPYGNYGLHIRYGVFSIFAFGTSLSLLFEIIQPAKKMVQLMLISALTYQVLTGFFFYPEVGVRKGKIQSVVSGMKQGDFSRSDVTFDQGNYEKLMRESIRRGIYKP